MTRYIIGLDASTQSCKAVVWDLNGHLIAEGRAALTVDSPAPGWAEQDARTWWLSAVAALRQAVGGLDPSEVAAIGLAWQRESFVMLDNTGEPLRPAILWLDQRATREAAQARADLGADHFHRLTGKQLDTTPSFSKLAWMRAHEPSLYRRLAKVLDVGSYLAQQLTGNSRTCLAGADSFGLLNLEQRTWSRELLDYLALQVENLPEVVAPGAPLGTLTAEAGKAAGLLPGTPLIAAGGDGQVFAVGVNAQGPETLSLTVGTSLVLGVHWPGYRVGPAYRTMAGCYPGIFLLEAVLRAGADIVRWFVHKLGPRQSEDDMEKAMAQIPAGCQGLLTVPYWKGRMVPTNDPLARGVTIGWSDYHTLAHFYRSLLEGIAFEVRLLIESYESDLGIAAREVHLGGGGALSATWRQIMADVTRREVVTSALESTALGAAMIAAVAVGACSSLAEASAAMYHPVHRLRPQPKQARVYNRLYREFYIALYPALRSLLVGLGRLALEKQANGKPQVLKQSRR